MWKNNLYPDITNDDWDSLPWEKINLNVTKIRQQIFAETSKYTLCSGSEKEKSLKRLQILQRRAIINYDNLCLVVKRVTQLYKGRNTPGLENFVIETKHDHYRLILFTRNFINIVN